MLIRHQQAVILVTPTTNKSNTPCSTRSFCPAIPMLGLHRAFSEQRNLSISYTWLHQDLVYHGRQSTASL